MIDFLESTVCLFGHWMIPMVVRDETLGRLVSEQAKFDSKARSAFGEWSRGISENYANIEYQINTCYGLPELEMLRVETCFCLIHGHWQAGLCLTNTLLEAFLKLSLVYSNVSESEKENRPLERLLEGLQAPVAKYMPLTLNDTINAACKKGLIGKETKRKLHKYRERFRNAFFHADLQSMFGDQTTPITGADLYKGEIDGPREVPIRSMPLLLGEALWRNARANAIPYFKEIDALIRETLPKVFPNMHREQTENTSNDTR